MNEKYLVIPGNVLSKSDGDEHFISAQQLMELYGVNPSECIVIDSPHKALSILDNDYIVLRPRYDGNYNLPSGGSHENP